MIKAYLKKEKDEMEIAMELITGPAVLIVFGVLSLFGWIGYLMYCICEPCCPP